MTSVHPSPGLRLAEGNEHAAAQLELVCAGRGHTGIVGLAVLGIVDRAVDPAAVGTGGEAAENLQPAQWPVTQGGIGVPAVRQRRVGAQRLGTDDTPADGRATALDLHDAASGLRLPSPDGDALLVRGGW